MDKSKSKILLGLVVCLISLGCLTTIKNSNQTAKAGYYIANQVDAGDAGNVALVGAGGGAGAYAGAKIGAEIGSLGGLAGAAVGGAVGAL